MNVITNVLQAIDDATGITPTAFSSSKVKQLPAVCFEAYRQSDNAVVESWRFQLRITAPTLEEAIEIDEEIADTLTTLGGEEKLGSLSIELNGGGTLEDELTGCPQLISYYDINTKS